MIRKKLTSLAVTFLGIFLLIHPAFGQDLERIREEVTGAPELYASIMSVFRQDCMKVKKTDLTYLYYGFAFTPKYKGNTDLLLEMYDALKAGDKELALKEALKCEERNPVCIEVLFTLAKLTDGTPEGTHYMKRGAMMLYAILSSGDGKTPQTAFKVIRTGDEYKLLTVMYQMDDMNYHASLEGDIDEMNFMTAGGKEMTVYFDRSLPTAKDGEIWGEELNLIPSTPSK